jgi:hypothetical protein
MIFLFFNYHPHKFFSKDVHFITLKTKNCKVLKMAPQLSVKFSRILILISFKLLFNLVHADFLFPNDELKVTVIALIVIEAHQEWYDIRLTLQCIYIV